MSNDSFNKLLKEKEKLENELFKKNNELVIKNNELVIKNFELELKNKEILKLQEKTYEELPKTGHVYILKCDGGFKIGKTSSTVQQRIKGLSTGNVDTIEIIMDYETSNADLLEKNVHYILSKYRCKSNREFFECSISYIKMVIETVGKIIDTDRKSVV